eukprot:3293604-Rhodomonas_salina.3
MRPVRSSTAHSPTSPCPPLHAVLASPSIIPSSMHLCSVSHHAPRGQSTHSAAPLPSPASAPSALSLPCERTAAARYKRCSHSQALTAVCAVRFRVHVCAGHCSHSNAPGPAANESAPHRVHASTPGTPLAKPARHSEHCSHSSDTHSLPAPHGSHRARAWSRVSSPGPGAGRMP